MTDQPTQLIRSWTDTEGHELDADGAWVTNE